MSKSLSLFLAVVFLCACEKTIIVRGNESPNGGDGIQIVFQSVRAKAVKKLRGIQNCSMRLDTRTDIKNWILENSNELAADIEASEHAWEQSENVPCGRTNTGKHNKIILSYASCRKMSPDEIFRVLVHESVHHFGIDNEEFPTNIANEVFNANNGNCIPATSDITWLDAEIASWPDSASITTLEVTTTGMCYDFKTAQTWPEVDPFNQWKTIGNYWIVAYIKDKWYATTYEWILPGHRCEQDTATSISEWTRHIEFYQENVWKWVPQKGELVGLIVSSVRRGQMTNGVEERTPIYWIHWPY